MWPNSYWFSPRSTINITISFSNNLLIILAVYKKVCISNITDIFNYLLTLINVIKLKLWMWVHDFCVRFFNIGLSCLDSQGIRGCSIWCDEIGLRHKRLIFFEGYPMSICEHLNWVPIDFNMGLQSELQ